MTEYFALASAKLIKFLFSRFGSGSAFPGRVALLLYPKLLSKAFSGLRFGVVMVSGSNGKSTTAALLATALRSQGISVFTNSTGANLPQGIASALVDSFRFSGRIKSDIAVLEVDEAYASQIYSKVTPDWVVLTNLQVDQLNRFSEPDLVYQMLLGLAKQARVGLVLNGSDSNLIRIGQEAGDKKLHFVDLSKSVKESWPVDEFAAPVGLGSEIPISEPNCVVESVEGKSIVLNLSGTSRQLDVRFGGVHNAIALALAAEAVRAILNEQIDLEALLASLAKAEPVYGRADDVVINGIKLRILMMKNRPSMQALLLGEGSITNSWLAVDEGTPDPSWIYDLNLENLKSVKLISGSRCWHWAARLHYAGFRDFEVIPDTKTALTFYLDYLGKQKADGTLIANYEQTLLIRKLIGLKSIVSSQ